MTQPFASGKHAFGFCDRCGFRYPLHDLQTEVVATSPTDYLVCPECWDPDNPQYQLGRYPIAGPQALENPRPDMAMQASRWDEGGSYGVTAWDFRDSAESWWSSGLTAGGTNTVTWNEASETISITQAQPRYMGIDYWEHSTHGGKYTSVDSDDFKVLTLRIKLTSTPSDLGNTWGGFSGRLYWTRDTDAGSSTTIPNPAGYETHASEPDWTESMGDRFVDMKWDMRNNSDWSGTITGFSIWFYDNTDADYYKTFEVDSIRLSGWKEEN